MTPKGKVGVRKEKGKGTEAARKIERNNLQIGDEYKA